MFGAKVLHKQNHCIFYYTDKIRIFYYLNINIQQYVCVCVGINVYEINQFYL